MSQEEVEEEEEQGDRDDWQHVGNGIR